MDIQAQGNGFIIWLTGMHRSGKSTLATLVAQRLSTVGLPAQLLDEDGEAKVLIDGLGPAKEEQARIVARLGYAARGIMKAGGIAVVSALSPYRDAREQVRREARRFLEVFVDCSMEALQGREGGSLYKKALAGEVKNVFGVDVPYEPPARAELTLHTEQLEVQDAVHQIFQAMVDARYLPPAEFTRLTGGLRARRAKPAPAARSGGRQKLAAKAAARKAPRKVPRKVPARGAKAAKRRR
ncbi:MAG: adenylyl-sulfate kinase [Anaeromyxobacter sp.]